MSQRRPGKEPRRFWSAEDDARMRELYPDTPTKDLALTLKRTREAVYARADTLGLRKSAAYLASADACRLRRGDNVGAACRFLPGIVPWNKGTHYTAGGRSAETRFKAGHKPQTWVPIGTVVTDADGYQKRKVRDDAPPGQGRFNWVFLHRELWEQHHGPIPRGHAVVFRNGDKRDLRIENLELLTRRALMQRNTVHNLPAPLPELIQLRGALVRKINRRNQIHGE